MGQPNNGLASIKLGAIAIDGGMGTVLSALGFTEEDSAKFNFDEPEKKEYPVEETDTPFFVTTKQGKKTFTFTVADPTVQTYVETMGGTVTGTGADAVYDSPLVAPIIERSLEVTPKIGTGFKFPRVLVTATLTDSIGKNALLGVNVTCEILQPTKAGVSAYSTFEVE